MGRRGREDTLLLLLHVLVIRWIPFLNHAWDTAEWSTTDDVRYVGDRVAGAHLHPIG